MKWLYHIPHVWESPTDRAVWEDVYLLPSTASDGTPSIWLTIDALGNIDFSEDESDRADAHAEALDTLSDSDWYITETDMLVRQMDFNLAELLEWVQIWLKESGFECSELIETPIERFVGSNEHASLVAKLTSSDNEDDDTTS